jgi:GH25 family lysozyme M1 (1,4-beta-N-acetylmuramidase)
MLFVILFFASTLFTAEANNERVQMSQSGDKLFLTYAPEDNVTSPDAGYMGVDISQLASTSTFSCMKNSGYGFGIPRAYRSNNSPDPNACQNIKNGHAGGMATMQVYIFPCATCSTSGAQQVKNMYNALKSAGCSYQSPGKTQSSNQFGRVWLDIEGTQYWSSSQSTNQNFFQSMKQGCKDIGISCGVYTSAPQWEPIMGASYTGGSDMPLWLAWWNGSPCTSSWSSYGSFGGWKSYQYQQFRGDTTVCSFSVDLDCALQM